MFAPKLPTVAILNCIRKIACRERPHSVLPEFEGVVRGVTEVAHGASDGARGRAPRHLPRLGQEHVLVGRYIARRTERVYDLVTAAGDDDYDTSMPRPPPPSFNLFDRLKRVFGCGTWAGKSNAILDYLIYCS